MLQYILAFRNVFIPCLFSTILCTDVHLRAYVLERVDFGAVLYTSVCIYDTETKKSKRFVYFDLLLVCIGTIDR